MTRWRTSRLVIGMLAILTPLASIEARPIKFKFQPQTAVGEYIPSHYFLKCKHGSVNPWDQCNGWRGINQGDVLDIPPGLYCLFAKWEDGKTAKISFTVTKGTAQKTITVKPSALAPMGACK